MTEPNAGPKIKDSKEIYKEMRSRQSDVRIYLYHLNWEKNNIIRAKKNITKPKSYSIVTFCNVYLSPGVTLATRGDATFFLSSLSAQLLVLICSSSSSR